MEGESSLFTILEALKEIQRGQSRLASSFEALERKVDQEDGGRISQSGQSEQALYARIRHVFKSIPDMILTRRSGYAY